MTKNNRERQAEFKRRMREAGKKQITVWVTPAQEQKIRTLLDQKEADPPAAGQPDFGPGNPAPQKKKKS